MWKQNVNTLGLFSGIQRTLILEPTSYWSEGKEEETTKKKKNWEDGRGREWPRFTPVVRLLQRGGFGTVLGWSKGNVRTVSLGVGDPGVRALVSGEGGVYPGLNETNKNET